MQDKNTREDMKDIERTAETWKEAEEKNEETEVRTLNTDSGNEHKWKMYRYTSTKGKPEREIAKEDEIGAQKKNEDSEAPLCTKNVKYERYICVYTSTEKDSEKEIKVWIPSMENKNEHKRIIINALTEEDP